MTGMTKQNYYKCKRARTRRQIDEQLVVELVRAERRVQPHIGARKLLVLIGEELREAGVELGRDRFFKLLREKRLLVRRPRRSVRTTDSRHRFPTYGNLLKDMTLSGPHQAWVSDLTYIRTEEGFVYLALVMDAYSRKIVGYHAGRTLEAEGCMRALRMALAQLAPGCRPVHHSDRGLQYACAAYTAILNKHGLPISMTEENHCYENAKAERLNGILKQEYGLGDTFATRQDAARAVAQAVALYNCRRPHTALSYRFPDQVHQAA